MKKTLSFLILAAAVTSAPAQADVYYKCKKGEVTVFSDVPCAAQAQVIERNSLRFNNVPKQAKYLEEKPQVKTSSQSEALGYKKADYMQAVFRINLLRRDILNQLHPSGEQQRLIGELEAYRATLRDIKLQRIDSTQVNLEFDRKVAELKKTYSEDKLTLAKLLFALEKERNHVLYQHEEAMAL